MLWKKLNLIQSGDPELVLVFGDDVVRHSERRLLRRADVSPSSFAAVSHLDLNTIKQFYRIPNIFEYEKIIYFSQIIDKVIEKLLVF